jgi:hypothetical protein
VSMCKVLHTAPGESGKASWVESKVG